MIGRPPRSPLFPYPTLFRSVVCGLISEYNATQPYAIRNWRAVLVNRIRLQGMIVFDWKERYGEALGALAGYFGQGRLKYRESVVEGVGDAAPGPRGAPR